MTTRRGSASAVWRDLFRDDAPEIPEWKDLSPAERKRREKIFDKLLIETFGRDNPALVAIVKSLRPRPGRGRPPSGRQSNQVLQQWHELCRKNFRSRWKFSEALVAAKVWPMMTVAGIEKRLQRLGLK